MERPATGGKPLVRADSAFYGRGLVLAAVRAGADVSVTVRLDKRVKAAIAAITDNEDAWTPIQYTDAIYDETTGEWISRAEVAEVPFTAFASRSKAERVPGRLVVRRIPDLNTSKTPARTPARTPRPGRKPCSTSGGSTPSSPPSSQTSWTPSPSTRPTAATRSSNRSTPTSRTPPSHTCRPGVFAANAAWLVLAVMAFNLTRSAATLAGPELAKARTGTIRRKLINVAARIASSARRITLHLPTGWPWRHHWTALFDSVCGPPATTTP